MVHDQDDKISNRYQRNDASVLERIEPPQEAQRYDEQHERRDPELAIHKEVHRVGPGVEAPHDSRHQVADDDEVGNADAKTFYRNGGIERHSRVRVCDLR